MTQRVAIDGPCFVAGNENSLWVAQDNSVLRLVAETFDPIAEVVELVDLGKSGDFFVSGDVKWVRQKDGFLFRLSPE